MARSKRTASPLQTLVAVTSAYFVVCCVAFCCAASGQVTSAEHEVRVHELPLVTARSGHANDVLAASLEIVLRNKEVCCGKNSALDGSLQAADPHSLKDIAARLEGRHLLSDGRPILVTTEYLAPNAVNAGHLIYMILNQHTPLMQWDSHLYVVAGVTYVENADYTTNSVMNVIHTFLLQDARFSDSRREITFDRLTQDASQVQGLLFLNVVPQ